MNSAAEQGLRSRDEASSATVELCGDLACISAFELLQTLQFLHKCGSLTLTQSDGLHGFREASCAISFRGLESATCGELSGREAVLAFVWWETGTFRFDATPVEPTPDSLAVQRILLDSVWLADEIEARGEVIPDRNAALELTAANSDIDLEGLEAAREIEHYLREYPGASRVKLERSLHFAPVTLGYALARLCEEGRVRSKLDPIALGIQAPEGQKRAENATPTQGSLFRLALAFNPAQYDQVPEMLTRFCDEFDLERGGSFFDPSGVSFVRIRLAGQRLLSITTLPLTLRNRFVFESILPSLELAIFLTGGRASRELDHWLQLVPDSKSTQPAGDIESALQELRVGLGTASGSEPSS